MRHIFLPSIIFATLGMYKLLRNASRSVFGTRHLTLKVFAGVIQWHLALSITRLIAFVYPQEITNYEIVWRKRAQSELFFILWLPKLTCWQRLKSCKVQSLLVKQELMISLLERHRGYHGQSCKVARGKPRYLLCLLYTSPSPRDA